MPAVSEVTVLPADGFNLRIVEQDAQALGCAPFPPIHHWFAGLLTQLPTTHPITLRLLMAGNDMPGNKATVGKWVGLHPLFSYADPLRYESYEWFARDGQGRWISGDFLQPAALRDAGDGITPLQTAIPQEVAGDFLSPCGQFWTPWQRITATTVLREKNIFEFRHHFTQPNASVAMHLPYTYTFQQQFLQRLRAAHLRGVFVDEIGLTGEGRAVQVIRVEDPARPTPLRLDTVARDGHTGCAPWVDEPVDGRLKDHRVIVVTAREHASEHTSSWPLLGMLQALTADTAESRRLRERTTWLLIPIYDPDSSIHSRFHVLTSRFYNHYGDESCGDDTPGEVLAYVRYLRAFVNSGRPIDLVASFYGLECNEGEAVMCPFISATEVQLNLAFNEFWFRRLIEQGIQAGSPTPWDTGMVPFRLGGWCADVYGALPLIFEVNDQYPACKLTRRELEQVGKSFVAAVVDFFGQHAGQYRAQETRRTLTRRWATMRARYARLPASAIREGVLPDILSMGY